MALRSAIKVAEAERELRAGKLAAERLASLRKRGLTALEREIGKAVGAFGRAIDASGGTEASPEAAGNAAAASARLQAVLRRIERASEILNGGGEIAAETITAGELARMAVERIRVLRGEDVAARIGVDVAGDLRVFCDPGLSAEALAEVLKNALKYSPPDTPVALRAVDAPPDRVRFEIEDRGPGIAEYVLEAAIDGVLPESTGRTSEPGAGLGLLMAKAVVDRHAGHFGIMSEPGHGAEVFLAFPSRFS